MKKKRLKVEMANKIVLQALEQISDIRAERVDVIDYGRDHIQYMLWYYVIAQGEYTLTLMEITERDYKNLLRLGFDLQGYSVGSIKRTNNRHELGYNVFMDVTDGYSRNRRKRS